jgi:forkhead box protein M
MFNISFQVAAECGKTKRPPFSYMTLIQMALYSKEDKRMRLRDICAWIENIFPYYKHTAKPGWKVGQI